MQIKKDSKIYKIQRYFVKKQITNHLGKVVETDDKITCFVKNKKVKKKLFSFCFYGIKKNDEELANKFDLNKPICYVIDGLKSEYKKIFIYAHNCELIIQNCEFDWNYSINFSSNGSNFIIANTNFNYCNIKFGAENLELHNVNINRSREDCSLYADNDMDIINSNLKGKDIMISAKNNVNLYKAEINGWKIDWKSKNIESVDTNSKITATEQLKIDTDSLKKLNIDSPLIIYKGNHILKDYLENINSSECVKIDEDKVSSLAIKSEIEFLNRFKKQCEGLIMEKLEDEETNIVSKLLK